MCEDLVVAAHQLPCYQQMTQAMVLYARSYAQMFCSHFIFFISVGRSSAQGIQAMHTMQTNSPSKTTSTMTSTRFSQQVLSFGPKLDLYLLNDINSLF